MENQLIITRSGGDFVNEGDDRSGSGPDIAVREDDVIIEGRDGQIDAALFHPDGSGPWPAVLIWPDIMGLRPAFREIGRRLARSGYTVLVPNLYFRVRPAPVIDDDFSFGNPQDREAIFSLRATLTDAHIESDSMTLIKFLRGKSITAPCQIGVLGYCLGGGFAFRSAAAMPEDVGVVASFHGSDLATSDETSPHRLVSATKANYLIQIAQNDDAANPDVKSELATAFDQADLSARIDVCDANHGWCVEGSAAYNPSEANQAWSRLEAVLRHTLHD